MWSKGSPRAIEINEPLGVLSGGRRRFDVRGQMPRFVYPMACGGGDNLPTIPVAKRPTPFGPMLSPRERSSQAIGAFYFSPALPSLPSPKNMDSLGAVDFGAESKNRQAFEEARRWRGGPRYEASPESTGALPPLPLSARNFEPQTFFSTPLSAR